MMYSIYAVHYKNETFPAICEVPKINHKNHNLNDAGANVDVITRRVIGILCDINERKATYNKAA